MLTVLKQAGLIRERRGPRFQVTPQLLVESLEPVAAAYEERRQRDQTKLEQMVVYAQTALCRTAALLEALGETGVDRCGECDNCRGMAIRGEAVAQGAA
jgi:ATP-dependent DNA helicase RecQ